ncbi:MAG: hypothetical protein U0556_02130 [Dehalococcoidia bacterium]
MATAFIAFETSPDARGLTLRLTRPPSSGPVSIRVQHRDGPPAASYGWLRRWGWGEISLATLAGLANNLLLLGGMLVWLLVPGWLLWRWIGRPLSAGGVSSAVGRTALWVALSTSALLALGALWSFGPIRLPGETSTFVLRLVALGLATLGLLSLGRSLAAWARNPVGGWRFRSARLIDDGSLALLLIVVGVIMTRAVTLAGIGGAPGVDSTSVADFARIIQQRGALLDVSPAAVAGRADFYHLGLSGLVALVSGTVGAPLDWTFLAIGQAMQIAALLGLVLLVCQWRGGAWAAAAALFVAGVVLPLPGFLLAWSRFTQIAGLALVPPLFALTGWTLAARRPGRLAAATAVVGVGLALTHYRALAFAAAAFPVVLLVPPPRLQIRWRNIWVLATAMAGAALLLAPWLIGVVVTFWAPSVSEGPAGPQEFQAWTLQYDGADWVLAGLAVASGAALLLLRRPATARPLFPLFWVAIVLALFTWSGVSGSRLGLAVNPLSAAIAYYLPIGLWAAWVVGTTVRPRNGIGLFAPAATVAVAGLLTLTVNRPATLEARLGDLLFYDDADRRAQAWLAAQVPPGARVANNGEAWAYGLFVGADGGYWTRILAGKDSLVPPLSYSFRPPEEIAARNRSIERSIELASRPDELIAFLREDGWTHIYLGRRGGAIDPADLTDRPGVRRIYDEGGVTIWEIERR